MTQQFLIKVLNRISKAARMGRNDFYEIEQCRARRRRYKNKNE